MANTTPQQEEKTAKKKVDNLAKARAARAKAAHKRKWDELWPKVEKSITEHHCTCGIKKGMTVADLKKLKGGCTSRPYSDGEMAGTRVRYTCPVLDQLRLALTP